MGNHVMFGTLTIESNRIIKQTALAYAMFDGYPVTHGHVLIVPKRIEASYFKLSKEEKTAMFELVKDMKDYLDEHYKPAGYNIGWNDGITAGQTIMHCHIHVIPRYRGDMDDPRGGVRGVIPHKQKYGGE